MGYICYRLKSTTFRYSFLNARYSFCTPDVKFNKSALEILLSLLVCMQTLCFHLGMTESFVWDYGGPRARSTDWRETTELLSEIHRQIIRDKQAFIYSHKVQLSIYLCVSICSCVSI